MEKKRHEPAAWIVECACGYQIRETSRDEAAAHARRHGKDAHGVDMAPEDALAMTKPAAGT